MENVEMYEVKVTEEVESGYNQMDMSPPKKRKSKAQEDSTDKPKKPRSAYLLYYFDVHQIMQQEVPNLPQSEINKRISENWKRLSVAEKGYYLEKAKLEKEGIDTSSPSPSKDVPGFRKILPRANYFLLAKGCPSNHLPGGSQPDVSTEPVDSALKGGPPSVTATQEPQFPPLGLASEMELSEQSITVEDTAEETAVASHSTVLQGALPSSSSSVSPKPSASSGTHVTQGSADSTTNGFKLKGNETSVPGSPHGGTLVQQIQGETTQVVAIIPTQNLLEPKTLTGVSSVGPVMMVSVESSVEQSAKPSYKMSVKTYTRRGRGRCLNPGCSFVYVTRHKPPTCPECGSHLGGKWIPAAKKAKVKEALSKQTPQKVETKSDESCHATLSPAEEGDADTSKIKVTEINKEALIQRSSRKQHAVTAGKPPEGSSTKQKHQTKPLDDPFKGPTVQSQDRSSAVVQKRPVRPILPAYYSTGSALFQIITVPPNKGKFTSTNNKSSVVAQESFSGLKPSTLKQLGQTVPTVTAKQDPSASADGAQTVASLTDRRVNILSLVPFKQHPVSNFDLGLSTARGRGRCKNPSCDYMYKNRHKPAVCPKCGCMLSQKKTKATKGGPLLDPYQALSPAQKDLQRQSTLQLLRRLLQIPESETELQEILTLIQELNSLQIVLVQPCDQMQDGSVETETLIESGWPHFFESAATQCALCNYPLFKGGQGTVAGQEDCWLLTETLIHTASLHLKVCLNVQCLALHSFTDLHPGLFNIGNRLLVSIDLFLRIRASIKLGHPPSHAAKTLLDHVPSHPVHALSPEESSQIQELLLIGYWAFECLTVRDYNDMICGICGVAPKLEIAQRYTDNVLELKNVEFTWPECSVSDEVHVDDFWLTMESEAIEQAAFPTDIPMTRVDASIIAPFIPPLMRSHTVINTEKDKVLSHPQQQSGDPSVLVRLIHDGHLRLNNIEDHSEDELKIMLTRCGVTITPAMAKNELLSSLISLYTLVHGGLSTAPRPPLHLTAGKLSKVCPHKVVCGSKCLVRGETARDHVDLLLSSRYWPPVYVSDCARQVAVCADTQYPDLATQMWGRNQGCFSDPFEKPEFVSCAELQEQPYSADLSLVAENQQVHPITKSSSCWLVHPSGAAQTQDPPSPEHHSMLLCRDLEPYVNLVTELEKKEGKELEEGSQHTNKADDGSDAAELFASVNCGLQQPVVFNNTAYYYLYNRLVDFLTSRDIVNQQINQVVTACQPGEVVIRDALYRLGVAKINTEKKEVEEEGQAQTGETSHEVVLLE